MNEFASEMQNQEGFSNVLVANKDGDKFKVNFDWLIFQNFHWLNFRVNVIHFAADLNFFPNQLEDQKKQF